MDPLVISGAVAGGIYALQATGVLAQTKAVLAPLAQGVTGSPDATSTAGDAITAAMNSLRGTGSLAGVDYTVDAGNSATNTFIAMKAAMVASRGAISNDSGNDPTGISQDDLVAICSAWLNAFDAGHAANPVNFARVQGEDWSSYLQNDLVPCASFSNGSFSFGGTPQQLSTLGAAACALSAYRDQVDQGNLSNPIEDAVVSSSGAGTSSGDAQTEQAFSLINTLASEMDAADNGLPGTKNTEQGFQLSNVPGGLEAAASATAGAVASGVKDTLGAAGRALLGSDLFWFVGLAFVGYLVIRKS